MKPNIAKLLVFHRRGHTLYYASPEGSSHCHEQGYENPESWLKPYHWWTHPPQQMSTHQDGYDFGSGIPVLDLRPAVETDSGASWVFKGPMVDVDLPAGAIDALPEVSPLMAPVIANYGMAGCLIQTRQAQAQRKAGSLDMVSTAEYVQGWKEHNARVGTYNPQTHSIDWQD